MEDNGWECVNSATECSDDDDDDVEQDLDVIADPVALSAALDKLSTCCDDPEPEPVQPHEQETVVVTAVADAKKPSSWPCTRMKLFWLAVVLVVAWVVCCLVWSTTHNVDSVNNGQHETRELTAQVQKLEWAVQVLKDRLRNRDAFEERMQREVMQTVNQCKTIRRLWENMALVEQERPHDIEKFIYFLDHK